MNRKLLKPHLALATLVILGLACGFNFSTANIADAYTAFDAEGLQPTSVYGQDDIFYAIVELANAPDDTTVRVVWITGDTTIDEVSFTGGDAQLYFSLTPPGIWDLGQYRVDIYLSDELATSLEFQVQ